MKVHTAWAHGKIKDGLVTTNQKSYRAEQIEKRARQAVSKQELSTRVAKEVLPKPAKTKSSKKQKGNNVCAAHQPYTGEVIWAELGQPHKYVNIVLGFFNARLSQL